MNTFVKLMPLRKRLQLVSVTWVVILMLCLVMPSAAAGTNTFTGSASVPDWITFTTTGSMHIARLGHTATLLNNGQVLVAAGWGGPAFTSAELYDPATGTWSTTGNINVGRQGHTATLLNNGQVLVAGGSNGPTLASAELYDPATGTWSTTGSMNVTRQGHTATLLNNGQVLVAGGSGGSGGYTLASAELYDPATGTWSTTGNMNVARAYHAATLLNNGQVLVAGAFSGGSIFASAELYDPTTGTWSTTGSMNVARAQHTATLLNNGQVLVAAGSNGSTLTSAELYDPATGTWSTTGSMHVARDQHTATLLNNGQVLVTGGFSGDYALTSAELYDPATGTWSTTSNINVGRWLHTAMLLNNGQVLVAGGYNSESLPHTLASAELVTLIPTTSNTFTGTLILPSGWLSSTAISAQFVGTTSAAAINAGALSNDNTTWGSWIAATSGVTTTTTWDISGEGSNKPVYLRLRDVNDQVTTVVTGTVNIDLTKPTSTMIALPATSPANISLSWSGSDALSGVSTYDVQVRAGTGGVWTDWLTDTIATSASFTGQDSQTYGFRVRARDNVDNVGDYSSDAQTTVDTTPPTGSLAINSGALNTTAVNVTLSLSSTDATSGVTEMELSNDGAAWNAWQAYTTTVDWALTNGDGLKTVFARFKDAVGNISLPVSNTITLDTAAGTEYGATINDGALFTNQTAVTLTISAKPGTTQIRVSNDGGFAGTQWEPYTSRKAWTITQYGSYVIPRVVYVRYKDISGNVSSNYQDDIILDVTPPTGTVSIIGATGLQAMTSTVALKLSATDDVSGVGQMLISNQPDFVGASWEAYVVTRDWTLGSNPAVYVRFRDNAGNVSATYSSSPPNIFLPLIQR